MSMHVLSGACAMTAMMVAMAGCLSPEAADEDRVTWRPGHMAQALLCPQGPPSVVLEVDHEPGVAPDPRALDAMRVTLETVSGRRVQVDGPSPIGQTKGPHDRSSAFDVHRATADHLDPDTPFAHAQSTYLHVLYLDGPSKEDRFLGTFVQDDVSAAIVLLPDYWRPHTPLVHVHGSGLHGPLDWRFERAVLVHELGHALGLVNVGTPMVEPHMDPQAPGHSSNPRSVMYTGDHNVMDDPKTWLEEKGVDPVWAFDEQDLMDLGAMRRGDGSGCPPSR